MDAYVFLTIDLDLEVNVLRQINFISAFFIIDELNLLSFLSHKLSISFEA